MSARAMAWAWDQELKIGPKFVLVALADHADGKGTCWPGQQLIAEKCGLSRQTVSEHIRALIAIQLIVEERSKNEKGQAERVRYHLQLDRLSMQPEVISMSETPTRTHVGFSGDSMSDFRAPNKEEPSAIESNNPNPLFELRPKEIEDWFNARFWPLYPKLVNKAKALRVLLDGKPDQVMLDEVLAGLNHRLLAERAARERGEWFRAWPDPHRWLRPSEARWRDRFDVPRETIRSDYRCACGAPAVTSKGRKWFCRACDPLRTGARA